MYIYIRSIAVRKRFGLDNGKVYCELNLNFPSKNRIAEYMHSVFFTLKSYVNFGWTYVNRSDVISNLVFFLRRRVRF